MLIQYKQAYSPVGTFTPFTFLCLVPFILLFVYCCYFWLFPTPPGPADVHMLRVWEVKSGKKWQHRADRELCLGSPMPMVSELCWCEGKANRHEGLPLITLGVLKATFIGHGSTSDPPAVGKQVWCCVFLQKGQEVVSRHRPDLIQTLNLDLMRKEAIQLRWPWTVPTHSLYVK